MVTTGPAPVWRRGVRLPAFEDLAEVSGTSVSQEGAVMIYTRYSVAAQAARAKRVVEIGCAAGPGLGLVGRDARFLVGADYCRPLLQRARAQYGARFPLIQLSGDRLPLRNRAFDVVLCLESYYYIPDTEAGLREIARVLAPGGLALITSANPERPDFIPSPRSVHYYTADEFRAALMALGLEVTIEAAFPLEGVDRRGPWQLARRLVHRLGLLPQTLRGRTFMKRLVYGKLLPVPAALPEDFAPIAPRNAVRPGPVPGHKILYVFARKPVGAA